MNPSIAQTEAVLRQEFGSLTFARTEFPMLTDWGIEDFSETVHSFGMNYLAALGRHAGRWAVSEFPVQTQGLEEDGFVRLDAVWWSRPSGQVELLAEFERYEPGVAKWAGIVEKARHLLLCHREMPAGPRLLLLMVWSLSGRVPARLEEVRKLARTGYRSAGNRCVAGVGPESRFLVATPVFVKGEGRLRLREVLL
jgi:hypothetical protein